MKKILIALLIMGSINKSFSQSAGALVTGSISNANKIPVESATISLLKSKDSSIVEYTNLILWWLKALLLSVRTIYL